MVFCWLDGTVYSFAGSVSMVDFLLGILIGLLITAILWKNEFPDLETDKTTGNYNPIVILGLDKPVGAVFHLWQVLSTFRYWGLLRRYSGKCLIGLPSATCRCLYDGDALEVLCGSPTEQRRCLHYIASQRV